MKLWYEPTYSFNAMALVMMARPMLLTSTMIRIFVPKPSLLS